MVINLAPRGNRRDWVPRRSPPNRTRTVIGLTLWALVIVTVIVAGLMLSAGMSSAQTYRTYQNQFGSVTHGSDGSTARSYTNRFGTTTHITGPNGERSTCRTYENRFGASTSCN